MVTPRIICFSEKKTARKCIDYISKYRSSIWCLARYEFGQEPVARINADIITKKRTPEEIKKYVSFRRKG